MKNVSPFAKLTCQEKQLKWLEYQSIRLPYVKANVDPEPLAPVQTAEESFPASLEKKEKTPPSVKPETPRPPQPPAPYPAEYTMKPRHRQYDAVIARMKQAEMRAASYTSVQ